jgi:hypothetical protein
MLKARLHNNREAVFSTWFLQGLVEKNPVEFRDASLTGYELERAELT